jgi:hypothetical protein
MRDIDQEGTIIQLLRSGLSTRLREELRKIGDFTGFAKDPTRTNLHRLKLLF